MRIKHLLVAAALAALAGPALAEGVQLQGWGPRFGFAFNPDQAVGGIQWNVAEDDSPIRFAPYFTLGFGDDHYVLDMTAPVHYVFRNLKTGFKPYTGGGVSVAVVDHDHGKKDDTTIEAALKGIGGMEWEMQSGNRFFVEVDLVFGDVYDLQMMAGFVFRAGRQ